MWFLFELLWVCGSSCFFCLPSDGGGKEVCVSCLMGGAGSGKNWVLLWWDRALLSKSFNPIICWWVRLPSLPSSCLAWGNPALVCGLCGRVNVSESVYAKGDFPGLLLSVPPSLWWASSNPCLHRRPSNTSSLLWGHCSSPLGLGAHKILFVPSKTGVSVSPSPVEVL